MRAARTNGGPPLNLGRLAAVEPLERSKPEDS